VRVAVVGATGNVGTAVLRRLREDLPGTEVLAVTRRVPDRTPAPPYDVVSRWVPCDVADPDARDDLAAALRGVDAVVHLAWAIQPSRDRARLRAVNVRGTRTVLSAARRADVPHVVVASSVGAYAGVVDDDPRGESWPTTGIATSTYSTDKAAVERLLDEAEARGLFGVTRVRPALVFQRGAGAEVGRLFLGPFVPKAPLDGPLPVLPWLPRLRLQCVHADDLAAVFREVLVRGATGAFNVAADGVLRSRDVAAVLGARRVVHLPTRAVRTAQAAAWHARLLAVGPGWLDMALEAPVLDTGRARAELGWRPQRTPTETLAELLDGLSSGAGLPSPPLHPRGSAATGRG